MQITFYGTRGSIPVCERNYVKYGGNTTCLLIRFEDKEDVLIIDAGTGIRPLGKLLAKEHYQSRTIYLGFTHFHWDHIQGFPFFEPAYLPGQRIVISALGKSRKIEDLKQIFDIQMAETYFPISLDSMGADFDFRQIRSDVRMENDVRVEVTEHQHPGGAWSLRIEYRGKSVVFCTDVEHGEALDQRIVRIARQADLLIHDAQYTPEQLVDKKGWGHSSWKEAMAVAKKAGVKRLILTHHDPDHDDDFLDQMEVSCQKEFPNCHLARELQTVTL